MKSLFWTVIRTILSGLIRFFNWVFTPKSIKRDTESQAEINAAAKDLTVDQYKACPFCVKVRRSMKRAALPIETKDAKRCETRKEELVAGGGQLKVPCLKIEENGEEKWMYESKEIISYLNNRFGQAA